MPARNLDTQEGQGLSRQVRSILQPLVRQNGQAGSVYTQFKTISDRHGLTRGLLNNYGRVQNKFDLVQPTGVQTCTVGRVFSVAPDQSVCSGRHREGLSLPIDFTRNGSLRYAIQIK